jgi:hypothetical protein
MRLSGKFLGTAVMLRSGHCCSTCLVLQALDVIPHVPGDVPAVASLP